MIIPYVLLTDLQKLMKALEGDLRERSEEVTKLGDHLRGQYEAAKKAERTAQAYEVWRDDYLTQAAAAWILACVFVRFCEDNGLVETVWLAGPGERLRLARDQHTLYFREHPTETDREYLLNVFQHVRDLPAMGDLFDERHNPIWEIGLSGDGATLLLEFWQRIEPETGLLVHDFTDGDWNTRFLGDLYQDLSESARDRYALWQTPDFVEEFILDRTLTPAIEEFGFEQVRMIDPACGSGHFLLGALDRFISLWQRNETGTNIRELAQRSLNAVYGVDVNPFAVAIARFRMLVMTLKVCEITRLSDAPAFKINLAAGDSLLHGPRPGRIGGRTEYLQGFEDDDPLRHVYHAEDKDELRRIFGKQYHVVVGNPPYIVPKDKALNQAYRERFGSCHRQYSLAVPFKQRMFDLAITPERGEVVPAGYVGMITANSFMKREFGKKIIEKFIPNWDLTHIVDTSGAGIPGHDTPTVILFGRNRKPVAGEIRTVMGIRGEPSTSGDPANGKVWTAICEQIDHPGSESQFVSVSDTDRKQFSNHPWSIGGGGAAELKGKIEQSRMSILGDHVNAIGRGMHTGCDESYFGSSGSWDRYRIEATVPVVEGNTIREWVLQPVTDTVFPYDSQLRPICDTNRSESIRFLWITKQFLVRRREPNGTHAEIGLTWYEWSRFQRERYTTPISIAFAFVATHNHFVLDRGGKVFKQSAPVIKLPSDATEDDHLSLLGLLNSSMACFWGRLTFFPKGGFGAGKWEERLEWDGTKLLRFPISKSRKILPLMHNMSKVCSEFRCAIPSEVIGFPSYSKGVNAKSGRLETDGVLLDRILQARGIFDLRRQQMIALQEELDWQVYPMYNVVDQVLIYAGDPPPIELGERAFEIVMARKMVAGELETTWFKRHGSTPITDIPAHWPEDYRDLVQQRIELIEKDRNIRLIEQPEYKRRWNTEPWESQLEKALYEWLLNRLESYFDFDGRMNEEGKATTQVDIELTSTARLAGIAKADSEFMQVGELYRNRADFDVAELVAELVESESVPFLPALRYKDSGLRKRKVWEQVWDLQRAEDAIDARVELPEDHPERISEEEADELKDKEVGKIPVPPKYATKDFLPGPSWRLRGKLDVPKERWISYPYCSREADPSLVIGWAGWNYLQQAQALAAYYVKMKEEEGWTAERLMPLLAGLLDILPWVQQWHNDMNPEFSMRMGDYYQDFLDEEVRALGMTVGDVKGWTPSARVNRRGQQRGRQR